MPNAKVPNAEYQEIPRAQLVEGGRSGLFAVDFGSEPSRSALFAVDETGLVHLIACDDEKPSDTSPDEPNADA